MEWIDWKLHPVPDDVRGLLIKYEDGIYSDHYDYDTGKRKYRESPIVGWKFMERRNPNEKTILCGDYRWRGGRMTKWYAVKDKNCPSESQNYTISVTLSEPGWRTDSGYACYGLPKEVAQAIVKCLNDNNLECDYEVKNEYWIKKYEK